MTSVVPPFLLKNHCQLIFDFEDKKNLSIFAKS